MLSFFSGFSVTKASIVRSRPAIEAAFCSAVRVTIVEIGHTSRGIEAGDSTLKTDCSVRIRSTTEGIYIMLPERTHQGQSSGPECVIVRVSDYDADGLDLTCKLHGRFLLNPADISSKSRHGRLMISINRGAHVFARQTQVRSLLSESQARRRPIFQTAFG